MYKINKLLKLDQNVFHTDDLGRIWGLPNKNTVYTTIKRYVQKGILIPVFKGLYATIPLSQIDPQLLGVKALHRYAYISTETVLAQEGIIFQQSSTITIISSLSRQFSIGDNHYRVRQLQDRYLYNPAGISLHNSVSTSNRPRALADLLYFNPHAHLDNTLIDWQQVRKIQKEVGYV